MKINEELHIHWIDKIAIANGFVSGIALWPQVVETIYTQVTAGLSIWALSIIFANSLVWVVYAVHRRLISLAIASILNVFASFVLLFLTWVI